MAGYDSQKMLVEFCGKNIIKQIKLIQVVIGINSFGKLFDVFTKKKGFFFF